MIGSRSNDALWTPRGLRFRDAVAGLALVGVAVVLARLTIERATGAIPREEPPIAPKRETVEFDPEYRISIFGPTIAFGFRAWGDLDSAVITCDPDGPDVEALAAALREAMQEAGFETRVAPPVAGLVPGEADLVVRLAMRDDGCVHGSFTNAPFGMESTTWDIVGIDFFPLRITGDVDEKPYAALNRVSLRQRAVSIAAAIRHQLAMAEARIQAWSAVPDELWNFASETLPALQVSEDLTLTSIGSVRLPLRHACEVYEVALNDVNRDLGRIRSRLEAAGFVSQPGPFGGSIAVDRRRLIRGDEVVSLTLAREPARAVTQTRDARVVYALMHELRVSAVERVAAVGRWLDRRPRVEELMLVDPVMFSGHEERVARRVLSERTPLDASEAAFFVACAQRVPGLAEDVKAVLLDAYPRAFLEGEFADSRGPMERAAEALDFAAELRATITDDVLAAAGYARIDGANRYVLVLNPNPNASADVAVRGAAGASAMNISIQWTPDGTPYVSPFIGFSRILGDSPSDTARWESIELPGDSYFTLGGVDFTIAFTRVDGDEDALKVVIAKR